MNKETILKKIKKFKPYNLEEWLNVIDEIYDKKTYLEFRKELLIDLKIKYPKNTFKDNLIIIKKEYLLYNI
jgi:hypothetical protein